MKRVKELKDIEIHLESRRIQRIANEAVMKAKEENKKHGIPEFFWKNDRMYYVLENGELTTEKPEILK